jgi:F-type H+-transporting ATPase subunit b
MRLSRSVTAIGLAAALSAASSGAAMAGSEMPQMNFEDPLTVIQVAWMAVIMVVLYLAMARWALPQIGKVMEDRKQRIADDLEAASQARTEAGRIVEELERAIRKAQNEGRAAIASAMQDAKEKARAEEDVLKARLEADLARVKEEIEQTRRAAVAVIHPVAEDIVRTLVERLTGRPAERAVIGQALDAAQR